MPEVGEYNMGLQEHLGDAILIHLFISPYWVPKLKILCITVSVVFLALIRQSSNKSKGRNILYSQGSTNDKRRPIGRTMKTTVTRGHLAVPLQNTSSLDLAELLPLRTILCWLSFICKYNNEKNYHVAIKDMGARGQQPYSSDLLSKLHPDVI